MTVIEKLESNIDEVNSAFQAIKSKIASNGVEVGEELRPIEYAPKVGEVYEAGKKDEYNAFWDVFQRRTGTHFCKYAGAGWTTDNFKPTQDIDLQGNSSFCFAYNNCAVDLVEWCNSLGITITIQEPTVVTSMFQSCLFTRIPEVNVSNATSLSSVFGYCQNLVTIDKLILKDDGSNTFSSTFYDCRSLENIVIEGVIGSDGVKLQWSPKLSKASITSFINALSSTTSGLAVSFSRTAVNNAFETAEGAANGSTSEEWKALIATKTNWTISLA